MNSLFITINGSREISWGHKLTKYANHVINDLKPSTFYNLNFPVELHGSNSEVSKIEGENVFQIFFLILFV